MTRNSQYPRSQYGALFDAHIHTYFDLHDGRISPKQLIRSTITHGFNWVNAMAHDTLRGVTRIKKLAKDVNLPVIPSMEISTGFNHILAYGVQEWNLAKDTWDPEIVIEKLREQDCAIYLSHPALNPFQGYWTPDIVKELDIDGLEWLNGSNFGLNKRTHKWFEGWTKGKIGGSDAHHPSQFGFAYTQAYTTSSDPDDLVDTLKRGNCTPQGRYVPFHRFLAWELYIQAKKKLFPAFFYEGKWIPPQYQPMGLKPAQKFDPLKWRTKILSQE